MAEVNVRELRNHGGDVLDRVVAGESLTVTRSGTPVAELRPVRQRGLSATELIERRRHLRPVDAESLREDVDAVLDCSL